MIYALATTSLRKPDPQWRMVNLKPPSASLGLLFRRTRYAVYSMCVIDSHSHCAAGLEQRVLLNTGQEALETGAPDKSSGSEHHHSRHRPVKTCDGARPLRPNIAEMPGRR